MLSLMFDNTDAMLKKMNVINSNDLMVRVLTKAIGSAMDLQDEMIEQLYKDLFFKTCSKEMLIYYEKEAGIIPEEGQSLSERRGILESKWKSSGHADVKMIESLAASWGRTVEVRIEEQGMLVIRFTDQFGEPTGVDGFMKAVGEAIPCHLGYKKVPRYVTVGELENMTVGEVEQLIIDNFDWKERERGI